MIQFSKHSGMYTLMVKQQLSIEMSEAWEFFSNPINLERITPSHMGFRVTSGTPAEMYPGQIISYSVRPIPWVKTNWVTEITHVSEGKFFVDEQRFGPYCMWHHEHHFEALDDGVLMTDKVSYKLPLGFFGHLAQIFFVKKQLRKIFEFRQKVLDKEFKI